jgi:hypothetical protein
MLISGLYGLPIQGENLSVREDLTVVCGIIAYELMKMCARDDSGCTSGYKNIK